MNRQELSAILRNTKASAHVKLSDALPYIQQLSSNRIEAIENASDDYTVRDLIAFVKMCDKSLCINQCQSVDSLDDLRECLTEERMEIDMTIRQLAKEAGVPFSILTAFEEGRCGLRVDTFLKLVNALGLILEII